MCVYVCVKVPAREKTMSRRKQPGEFPEHKNVWCSCASSLSVGSQFHSCLSLHCRGLNTSKSHFPDAFANWLLARFCHWEALVEDWGQKKGGAMFSCFDSIFTGGGSGNCQ
jgi:hypothetical protein